MSDRAMAWARSVKTGKSGRKTVLMVLADRASTDGVVHDCTQRDIAEEAELSERQVRTLLHELEVGGVIVRERRPGSGKGRENDIIRLRMAELPLVLGAQPSRQPENSSGGQATGNHRRLPQPEKTSACRSPLGLRAWQPETISACGGQSATGNRKILPVDGGQPEVQSRKILPVAPVDILSPHTPLSELPPTSESNPDRVVISPPYSPPPSPPKRRAGQGASDDLPADFVEAWKLWPKHVRASNKKLCAQLWAKRGGGSSLVEAVRRYLASPDATKPDQEGRPCGYVPAFEVWLRNKADFWLEVIENREPTDVHVLDPTQQRAPRFGGDDLFASHASAARQGRRPRTHADVLSELARRARESGQ